MTYQIRALPFPIRAPIPTPLPLAAAAFRINSSVSKFARSISNCIPKFSRSAAYFALTFWRRLLFFIGSAISLFWDSTEFVFSLEFPLLLLLKNTPWWVSYFLLLVVIWEFRLFSPLFCWIVIGRFLFWDPISVDCWILNWFLGLFNYFRLFYRLRLNLIRMFQFLGSTKS